jgi:hypothetical protein
MTHLYEDVGDEKFWRRGGIATVVVEREVSVGERWDVSCFQRGQMI